MAEAVQSSAKIAEKNTSTAAELARLNALRLRAEPRYFIMLLLGLSVYFISASIGSGWALFLSCALFCCCFLATILPILILKCCSVSLAAPEQVSAGDKFAVAVRLNCGQTLASLSRWMILQMVPAAGQLYGECDAEVIVLESLQDKSLLSVDAPSLKRGVRQLLPLAIETSFPMGMLWCTGYFQASSTITVLPRITSIEGKFLYRLRSGVYVPGDAQGTNSGFQSCSSRGVREYNRGDSRRYIHWSSSARHGRLMVRELEQEGLPAFDLIFDAAAVWQNSQQFELAISAVASVLELGHSTGIHPDLFVLDEIIKSSEQPGLLRRTDIEQQLLSLAAITYRKPAKNGAFSSSDPSAFSNRTRAVVLVTPLVPSSADTGELLSGGSERSRSSVFVLKVSAIADLANKPHANANEFILCKLEELCDL